MNTLQNPVRRDLIVGLWLGCALLVPAAPGATTKVIVEGEANGPFVQQIVQSSANVPATAAISTNGAGTVYGGWKDATGAAMASAEVGHLRLHASAAASAQMTFPILSVIGSSAEGRAQAFWNDNFTVNAGTSLAGQAGQITVTLVIDGALSVSGDYRTPSTSAQFQMDARLTDSAGGTTVLASGGTRVYIDYGGQVKAQPVSGALLGPGVLQRTVPVHFGRPLAVSFWADATDYAPASAGAVTDGIVTAEASSDFSQSVIWAGITDVRLADGTPVTGASVTSDSGYDYLLGTVTNGPVITRIAVQGQQLALEWTDLGPRSYTLEASGSALGGTWTPAGGIAWPIQAHTVLLPLPTQSSAFFRVKVR